ncbi:hypothetical protein MBM_02093 [Drepanopeziza brunnea f. sp. 'multigermtubi' MB_m1]|uniref:Uncharacterized protein n=1 Tax=Marssonina brunnea f. sp. multigermtubi (strain MB_m1) TaxID=1072389 RepID=K1X4R6_MARBU|nr:uncharacterized protein MBM_02093 [Drepanopeziza brunnea f. sp. 'multigermtubi' MB_m1]EKD20141.1 hypothetical protein MBM_02093 [Drepanopeziza brunnea f. sp. 'multigermtubi' MB_m1]
MKIVKSVLKSTDIIKLKLRPVTRIALTILTMTDEEETEEISKEIEATGTKKLRAADLYLRAKELALFAKSFFKELNLTFNDYLAAFFIMLTKKAITFYYNHVIKAKLPIFKANAITVKDYFEIDYRRECFKKLAKELKGIQSLLRPSLKDDKSFADKLYSAYKNVLKTIITRINFAFTFTAVVADIRKAIAFAIKTYRPLAKARAYASFSELYDHTCSYNTLKADFDLNEEYECFIQDR